MQKPSDLFVVGAIHARIVPQVVHAHSRISDGSSDCEPGGAKQPRWGVVGNYWDL